MKSNRDFAPALLLICAARHYGWALFPELMRGSVSKALGAAAALCLLWLVAKAYRTRYVLPVVIWWAWEEAQTLLCSVAYAYAPWEVPAGQSVCSAGVAFDLGAFGLVAMAVLAYRLSDLAVTETSVSQDNDR